MRRVLLACCLLFGCAPDEQNLGLTTGSGGGRPAVGSPRWAVAIGSANDDSARATAIDSIGDVVAVGGEVGPPDAQGVPSSSSGFVTKRVASDGSERWTVPLLPTSADSTAGAASVAIDAQGSVIVTGSYRGIVDFGGQTLIPAPSHADTFIAKYTWDGHLQWVRGLDPTAESWATAVAIDSAGRIIVVGGFGGTLTLGADHYTADSNPDAYLAVFDPSGMLVWGHVFQGAGVGPDVQTVAITANGDIVIGGGFETPGSFGGATLDPAASTRGFLARYRSDGLYLSSQVFGSGSPSTSEVTQIDAIPSGIVVRTTEASDAHHAYGVIHVLDDSGQETWSGPAADGNINNLGTLAVAPSGLIVSSTWDDNVHNEVSTMDVLSYDPSGDASSMTFGSQQRPTYKETFAWGCAVGATGAIAYAGEFSGQLDFGSGPLATHGQNDTDAYIVLLDPPM